MLTEKPDGSMPQPLPGRGEGFGTKLNSDLAVDDHAGPGASHWASTVLLSHHQDETISQTQSHGAVRVGSLVIMWLLEPTTKGGVSAEWQSCL